MFPDFGSEVVAGRQGAPPGGHSGGEVLSPFECEHPICQTCLDGMRKAGVDDRCPLCRSNYCIKQHANRQRRSCRFPSSTKTTCGSWRGWPWQGLTTEREPMVIEFGYRPSPDGVDREPGRCGSA